MDPQLLRAGARIAVLILLLALVSLPFQAWGSAESVVTVLAAAVALVFLGLVAIVARLANPRLPGDTAGGRRYNVRSTTRGSKGR